MWGGSSDPPSSARAGWRTRPTLVAVLLEVLDEIVIQPAGVGERRVVLRDGEPFARRRFRLFQREREVVPVQRPHLAAADRLHQRRLGRALDEVEEIGARIAARLLRDLAD